MHYGRYANGYQFDAHLADFTFFAFFQDYVFYCYLHRLEYLLPSRDLSGL